jgi:hypothetical protein
MVGQGWLGQQQPKPAARSDSQILKAASRSSD